MNLGIRIRNLREKSGISRKELAQGIVSYSHMSNIESGRFVPGDDVLRLLAQKLNVPENYLLLHNEKDEDLEKGLVQLKKEITLYEDSNKAREVLKTLKAAKYIISCEQEAYFLILASCYYFHIDRPDIANKYLDETTKVIEGTKIETLPKELCMSYFTAKYMNSFYKKEYYNAYENCLKALEYSSSEVEVANANYNLSCTLLYLFDYKNAISISKLCIKIYKEQKLWKKLAKSYNLLGSIYWDMNSFEKAHDAYKTALNLIETNNSQYILDRVVYNIGLIQRKLGNINMSQDYFIKSLELKKEYKKYSNISITYRAVIEGYIDLDKPDLANKYIDQASSYCKSEADKQLLNFSLAKIKYLNKNYKAYERLMINTIDYCINHNIYRYVDIHSQMLADYYFSSRYYKKASKYYKKTVNLYNARYKENINVAEVFIRMD